MRDFVFHGVTGDVRCSAVDSNKAEFKYQAIYFDTDKNAWIRLNVYANTLNSLKENAIDYLQRSETLIF